MFEAPAPESVLKDLGDQVVRALSRSVARGREDLGLYRRTFPGWVAASSERGLANWIHDRVWDHLVSLLAGTEHVTVVDDEPRPRREVYVGVNYRLRVKRHHLDGSVSSYETQAALEFFGQGGTLPFPALEEIHLIAGYEWDREIRSMGAPMLSLRNGKDNLIWQVPLPEVGEQGGTVYRPTRPEPTGPTVDLPGVDVRRDGSEDEPQ